MRGLDFITAGIAIGSFVIGVIAGDWPLACSSLALVIAQIRLGLTQ